MVLGALLETSWKPLGPFWAVVEAFWAVFETSWANLEVSWTLLGRLGSRLGPSWAAIWAVLEAILAVLEASWRPSWAILGRLERKNPWQPPLEDPSGWPAGRAGAPGGVLLEKEPKPKP